VHYSSRNGPAYIAAVSMREEEGGGKADPPHQKKEKKLTVPTIGDACYIVLKWHPGEKKHEFDRRSEISLLY